MSYLAEYKATTNTDFTGRVAACARKTANDVLNEPTSTANYQGRRNLAMAIMRDPMTASQPFVWQAVNNATIGTALNTDGSSPNPDSDFEYVISSTWDTVVNLYQYI